MSLGIDKRLQSLRSRELSDFRLQMVLGKRTRFMQNLRVNVVRLVKHPIDEGISSIAVLLKSSILRSSIIHGSLVSF